MQGRGKGRRRNGKGGGKEKRETGKEGGRTRGKRKEKEQETKRRGEPLWAAPLSFLKERKFCFLKAGV